MLVFDGLPPILNSFKPTVEDWDVSSRSFCKGSAFGPKVSTGGLLPFAPFLGTSDVPTILSYVIAIFQGACICTSLWRNAPLGTEIWTISQ